MMNCVYANTSTSNVKVYANSLLTFLKSAYYI